MSRRLASSLVAIALAVGAPTAAIAQDAAESQRVWVEGQQLEKAGRWREAAEAYVRSATIEQACPKPRWKGYANILTTAADLYTEHGERDTACTVLARGADRLEAAKEDRYAAAMLGRLGMAHKAAGRYAEAIAGYERALMLARKLGNEAMVSDLLANAGVAYTAWGKLDKGVALLEEALGISRRRGDAYEVGYALSDLAAAYTELGRYDEALARAEESAATFRKLGHRKALAMALGNLANVREAKGQFTEALALNQEVLAIQRAEGLASAATVTLNNLGGLYDELGRYEEAVATYQECLAATRALGLGPAAALTLSNLGTSYMSLGRFDEAQQAYEEALATERRLGRDAYIASNLSNLGHLYVKWGRPDLGQPLFEQALAMDRAGNRPVPAAQVLTSLGGVHLALDRPDQALACHQEALAIYRKQGAEGEVPLSLANLGHAERALGRPEQALAHYTEALALSRKQQQESVTASMLLALGTLESDRAAYAPARDHFAQALATYRRLGQKSEVAFVLSHLAIAQSRLGSSAQAIASLEEAVTLLDALRQTARGELRRDYMANSLNTYQHLVDLHARAGHAEAALEASERSRAKLLAEMLSGGALQTGPTKSEAAVPSVSALKAANGPQMATLVYACATKPELVQLVLTQNSVTARLQPTAVKASAPAAARPAQAEPTRGVGLIDAPEAEASPDLGGLVAAYRGALVRRDAARARALAHSLYTLLVAPIEPRLAGKTELLVVPDAALGFLPFETLIDDQGRYLAERFRITYTHSLAVRALLAGRHHPADRRPLLAFGGATYQGGETAPVRGAAAKKGRLAAYQALSRGAELKDAYGSLGFGAWAELPGTRREVEAIAALLPGAQAVTGPAVSETQVKALSSAGTLARYRVLHFATHGLTVPEVPELSALVLSQGQGGAEDGYLRTSEVAALKLQADFVNLSACETGLGKLYGGEGVVGLSQSFLLAGANGLSMSLWSVADDSTATFMTELYKTASRDGVGYAEAAARVKRRFIRGEFGEAYKQPFYWAPFVHYGL